MKTLKRIKKWYKELPANISKRFLVDMHPVFLQSMQNKHIINKSVYQNLSQKKAEKIMKLLSSPKYKKYFYKVVAYDTYSPKEIKIPKTWYGKMFDKIAYNISKLYVFLFAREIYDNIKSFEIISKSIVSLNNRINEYMLSTTVGERLARANSYNIINDDKIKAYARLSKFQSSRVSKILAHNKL